MIGREPRSTLSLCGFRWMSHRAQMTCCSTDWPPIKMITCKMINRQVIEHCWPWLLRTQSTYIHINSRNQVSRASNPHWSSKSPSTSGHSYIQVILCNRNRVITTLNSLNALTPAKLMKSSMSYQIDSNSGYWRIPSIKCFKVKSRELNY